MHRFHGRDLVSFPMWTDGSRGPEGTLQTLVSGMPGS